MAGVGRVGRYTRLTDANRYLGRESRAGRRRQRLASCLISWPLGPGGHVFAENYEQQQKNVARLRLIETDQKDQAPIDDQMNSPPPGQAASVPAAPAGASATLPLRGVAKPAAPAAAVH